MTAFTKMVKVAIANPHAPGMPADYEEDSEGGKRRAQVKDEGVQ